MAGLLDPPLLGGGAPRHPNGYISDSRVAGQLVRVGVAVGVRVG